MGERRRIRDPAQERKPKAHQANLLLFKLPSSETVLEEPLFLESHDFTPSTRSSSSESASESPSLKQKWGKGMQESVPMFPVIFAGNAQSLHGAAWGQLQSARQGHPVPPSREN